MNGSIRSVNVRKQSEIAIKQADTEDIPVIENILLDAINWLNEMGQPLWEAEAVSWNALSRNYKIGDFYIAYLDGKPSGCNNAYPGYREIILRNDYDFADEAVSAAGREELCFNSDNFRLISDKKSLTFKCWEYVTYIITR